ncbi:hypothetical protein SanaruYs_38780 [Chryseotalea sanaruensis]|uniref:Uncharacterized protein n=1 Tax=Chryseotalea sanaruensis TaxID=2482724 RepID=A0A401UFG5_9BACT|nr:hypothetical protein [Chryseotalea sanaruensis]GCC53633.1 hypothetical protein SanaruYs_38780 [Chryseotalea sanaruensis]
MKKNPLNDLDQFLKQEASSIVTPSSLSDRLKQNESATSAPVAGSIEEQLLLMAKQDASKFYDTLITVGEKIGNEKSTMLINTALYLKHGDNWKEAVKAYWEK